MRVEGGLEGFAGEARARLERAQRELADQRQAEDATFASAEETFRAAISERVDRYLKSVQPRVGLLRRTLGGGRAILHVERVTADDSVLLLRLFTGAIPSRYGFLSDDSTDDALKPPTLLYPDDAGDGGDARPDVPALQARLSSEVGVHPVKGFIPVWVPSPEPRLFRLLSRGVVLEVEVADGRDFRNVLTAEEAERFAGHLVRLKLEGKLRLELS